MEPFYIYLFIVAAVFIGLYYWAHGFEQGSSLANNIWVGRTPEQTGPMDEKELVKKEESVRCPQKAYYDDDKIVVVPGNRVFTSLDSYRKHYESLREQGLSCDFVSPSRGADPEIENLVDEQTYAKTPIRKLDDYEYTRVFKGKERFEVNRIAEIEKESRNEFERTVVNALTAIRQFDWSQLPFNSAHRASKEQPFNGQRADEVAQLHLLSGTLSEGFTNPKTEAFYGPVSGSLVQPTDYQGMDEREKAILQQYAPKRTEDLLEHEQEDVEMLVKKLYETDPDWEPVVEKVKGNEFKITGLKPKVKAADIQFEDEKQTSVKEAILQRLTGEEEDEPEHEKGGKTKGLNNDLKPPKFTKKGVLDYDNDRFYRYEDFHKWHPSLERSFGPTFDREDWIGIGIDA